MLDGDKENITLVAGYRSLYFKCRKVGSIKGYFL